MVRIGYEEYACKYQFKLDGYGLLGFSYRIGLKILKDSWIGPVQPAGSQGYKLGQAYVHKLLRNRFGVNWPKSHKEGKKRPQPVLFFFPPSLQEWAGKGLFNRLDQALYSAILEILFPILRLLQDYPNRPLNFVFSFCIALHILFKHFIFYSNFKVRYMHAG